MKLGIVTYQWGANWDLPTLIKNCAEAGYAGAELRTTHRHGVEVSLSKEQRAEVQKRFVDSGVELIGLGSTCEFHSSDPAVVKKNVELTKEFIMLAHDVGGSGVKVRPNGLVKGKDRHGTAEQIGKALHECGQFAEGYGMPVLEAMAAGIPIACSDIAPLREVAGDTALFFDPLDERAISEALDAITGHAALRRELSQKGPQRASGPQDGSY